MNKNFLSIAAFLGVLSVILGAFAAHTLQDSLPARTVAIFETGVRYQFYHLFALFLVAILSEKMPGKWMLRAGNCFIIGIILFSGSLYTLTALRAEGMSVPALIGILTPLGGLFFIAGWVCLLMAVLKKV
jgi:uncharacterized membrane protein YgdD (TMEM256/DUF423 family)